MIRVLHVTGSMNRGGIETFLMNIYRNIDRNKVQFDFLLYSDGKDYFHDEIIALGGKVFKIIPRNKGILQNKRALEEFFKCNQYEIVHQHLSSLSYVTPLKIAKKFGVNNRIVHSHNTRQGGSSIHTLLHYINQRTVTDIATDFFTCSDLAAEWLYPKDIYERKKYKLVNNGINVNEFKYQENSRIKMRKELNIKEGTKVIGHVGRFNIQKNHEFLIEIFKAYQEIEPDSKLILVGDGELKKDMMMKVEKYKISDDVLFLGVRSDIPDLLQSMDCFLMPSFHEGFPVTLVEAQASGLPCVISSSITDEIIMTDIVKMVSLSSSADSWSREIIKMTGKPRYDKTEEIKLAGFDSKSEAIKLEHYYLELIY